MSVAPSGPFGVQDMRLDTGGEAQMEVDATGQTAAGFGGQDPFPTATAGSAPQYTAPPGAAAAPSDGMAWTAEQPQGSQYMQVDGVGTQPNQTAYPASDQSGAPIVVPLAGPAPPPVIQARDPALAPVRKLTVDLIKTYRHINYVRIRFVCMFRAHLLLLGVLLEEAKEGAGRSRPKSKRA